MFKRYCIQNNYNKVVPILENFKHTTMLPAKPNILKCPHCGRLMRISALMSGNTFDMVQWSDTKCVTPMMESVSPVLKCPVCKKYFFYNRDQIVGSCNTWCNSSWGHLSYKSLSSTRCKALTAFATISLQNHPQQSSGNNPLKDRYAVRS